MIAVTHEPGCWGYDNVLRCHCRVPQRCPRCHEMCAYDGWDHVHTTGIGVDSCTPESTEERS